MNITVYRKWKKATYTIGKLLVNGNAFCESLEDKDRGLSDNMTEAAIKLKKVYAETAIPTGTYEVKLTFSSKFSSRRWGRKYKGLVPQIMNVKGFSGVRIHPANTALELEGCIAIGKNQEVGKVLQSTIYYYKLMDTYIVPASNRGEKIYITII